MTWFENLMDGIERNLLTKNRDRFTQNLSVFRRWGLRTRQLGKKLYKNLLCRDINDGLKGPNVTSASSVNDMMT